MAWVAGLGHASEISVVIEHLHFQLRHALRPEVVALALIGIIEADALTLTPCRPQRQH